MEYNESAWPVWNLSADVTNVTYESLGDDIINDAAVQAVFLLLYTTIFVLGIFGNVLVCYVVFRNKAMHTVTNLFITNLALSDILLCIVAVPFTPLYSYLNSWIFGDVICHLLPYTQGASVYISTLTLTSIAVDRYLVIIYPFRPRMRMSTCVWVIVAIWAFSMCATIPYGVYMQLQLLDVDVVNGTDRYSCAEVWPAEWYRRLFGGITSTLQFIIPFLLIAYCYICVSIRLQDRAKNKPGAKGNSRKEEADRERKRRTNRMLIAMVVIFLVSWLPLNLFNIINDFDVDFGNWAYYMIIFFMVHSVAMSSTCYNPFLYAWLNENFRKEFKQVLPCFDHHRHQRRQGAPGADANRGASKAAYKAAPTWRSERTCNGNDTQESLLPSSSVHHRGNQQRRGNCPSSPVSTPSHAKVHHRDDVGGESGSGRENGHGQLGAKARVVVGSAEEESMLVPVLGAVFDPVAETVKLKLITEEEPPPYDNSLRIDV